MTSLVLPCVLLFLNQFVVWFARQNSTRTPDMSKACTRLRGSFSTNFYPTAWLQPSRGTWYTRSFLRVTCDGLNAMSSCRAGPSPQSQASCSTLSSTPSETEADTFFCLYGVLSRLHPFYMFEKDMSYIMTHTRDCLHEQ